MRGLAGSSIILGAAVGLVLLPAVVCAKPLGPGRPVLRAEVGYGKLTHQDRYSGTFEDDERTVWLDTLRGPTAPAWSGRLSAGVQADWRLATLYPHVFVTYAGSRRVWMDVEGAQQNFPLHLSVHYWALGFGGELQLLRRVLLLDVGAGYAEGYSYFSMPSVESGRHRTDRLAGFLVHAAIGVRLPVEPVSAGVRLLTDASIRILREPLWPIGFPVFYAAIAGFVDFDVTSLVGGL
jgi:hypothetical protein